MPDALIERLAQCIARDKYQPMSEAHAMIAQMYEEFEFIIRNEQAGTEMKMKIKGVDRIQNAFYTYARVNKLDGDKLRFMYKGEHILQDYSKTASDIDLQAGDVIIVVQDADSDSL